MDGRWPYPCKSPYMMPGPGMYPYPGTATPCAHDPYILVHKIMKDPYFRYYAWQNVEHLLGEYTKFMYMYMYGMKLDDPIIII